MKKEYTNLWAALEAAYVSAERTGPAENHLGRQVCICIFNEQGEPGVYLYFDIDSQGNETFVCQE